MILGMRSGTCEALTTATHFRGGWEAPSAIRAVRPTSEGGPPLCWPRSELREHAVRAHRLKCCPGGASHQNASSPPSRPLDGAAVYAALRRVGLQYGPAFNTLAGVRHAAGGALPAAVGRLHVLDGCGRAHGWLMHPSLLDGCFHLGAVVQSDPGRGAAHAAPAPRGRMMNPKK